MSHTFILYYKQRVVENKLITVKSKQTPLPYLPTFMRCYFSHVLVNCMHAIHFPQGTLSFFSSERSDWGSELYGRYISVQEHSTERVGPITVIYSKSESPRRSALSIPLASPLGSRQSTEMEKTETVVYKFSCLVLFLVEDGN